METQLTCEQHVFTCEINCVYARNICGRVENLGIQSVDPCLVLTMFNEENKYVAPSKQSADAFG